MMINALNSGARVFMADLEDALSPTWANVVGGQAALIDAVRGTLAFDSPEGKAYRLGERIAHARRPAARLAPRRVARAGRRRRRSRQSLFDCRAVPVPQRRRAARARERARTSTCPSSSRTTRRGSGTRSSSTPRRRSAIPRGSIRATVLIETILAAFEMDEILYELREHAAGLNAGRWDYLFSVIKKLRDVAGRWRSPDRSQLTMTVPFMRAYTRAAGPDLPSARRARDRRHGGVHPEPPRPRGHRDGARQGPRRQGARVRATGSTARGSPIPTSSRSRPRSSIACSATRPNQKDRAARGGRRSTAAELLDLRGRRAAPSPRPGSGPTSASRSPTSTRGCAAPAPPRSTT